MISRRAFVTGPSTRRGTATPVFAPRVISCVRDPGFGGYPSTILVTAWDRRRGRERETYTLQGYSPVLGNRPPEFRSSRATPCRTGPCCPVPQRLSRSA